MREHDSWKLERNQDFDESGNPGYDAFRRGEWDEALSFAKAQEPALREAAARNRERGTVMRRVRIVEEPLSPYVQWELHFLRVRARSGSPVRVLTSDQVGRSESDGPLPELVSLGGQVLYHILYSDAGIAEGAVRFVDPPLIREWERFIAALFDAGEELDSYMERYAAHLPPPTA
ncbi:hypothetical protein DEH69_08670 [Streptomyces sp. PT12]|nr:hypothetical protein DEH69_08670 [Streptomyces sp. PT12]